jgi:hypothetical protein
VFDHILQRVRQKVRALDYVMTLHAEEAMENDDISILDVEHAILTGEISERQPDQETGEWKYLFAGNTLADDPIIVVAKLELTGTLVIITVYRDEYRRSLSHGVCCVWARRGTHPTGHTELWKGRILTHH